MGRVEINLMPPNLVQKKTFRRQAPVLIASAAALAVASGTFFLAAGEKASLAQYERDAYGAKVRGFETVGAKITAKEKELEDIRSAMLPGTWLVSLESAEVEPEAVKDEGEDEARGGRPRRGRDEEAAPMKAAGYRIVAKGFQDVLRRVEQSASATGKTAPEMFCGLLAGSKSFASAKVVGQKVVDADNTVEFTVEAALAQAQPETEDAKME